MAWPELDADNLETRVRTYLNEATAKFYTQAEIWRWLSRGARVIAEKTLCVRRILTSATGGANVRNVVVSAIKVLEVEYVPSSGRPMMLVKIDPLKIGHYPLKGTAPQYWYEHGTGIDIEPIPDAVYSLRLYIADVPKLVTTSAWTDWSAGARWTMGATAIHTGASSGSTLAVTSGSNYTFEFNVTANAGSIVLAGGTVTGATVTTVGYHTQTITPNSTTLTLTGVGDVTIGDFKIYKEADISATSDQIELAPEWYNQVCLYAAHYGLLKDKQYDAAAFLASINAGEAGYLTRNIVSVIPDGRENMEYR